MILEIFQNILLPYHKVFKQTHRKEHQLGGQTQSHENPSLPRRRHIRIGRVQVPRGLGPPGPYAAAVVAATTGAGGPRVDEPGSGHVVLVAVEGATPELQLFPVHLLLLVPEQLVEQHAGEDAGEDAGDADAEEGAQAGEEGALDDVAVGRALEEDVRVRGIRVGRATADARPDGHAFGVIVIFWCR